MAIVRFSAGPASWRWQACGFPWLVAVWSWRVMRFALQARRSLNFMLGRCDSFLAIQVFTLFHRAHPVTATLFPTAKRSNMNSRGCKPTAGCSRNVRPRRGRRCFGLVPWADAHGYSCFVSPGQSGAVRRCARFRRRLEDFLSIERFLCVPMPLIFYAKSWNRRSAQRRQVHFV